MNQPVLSKSQILRLFVLSFIVGGILVVGAVMPAEFGVDPIGTGKLLGLNKLYAAQEETAEPIQEAPKKQKVKVLTMKAIENEYLAGQTIPKEVNNSAPAKQYDEREDNIQVVVPAGKGIEYKVKMLKHGNLKYEWNSGDETMFFDFHGDPFSEIKTGWYQSYTIAYSNNMVGTFIAPFEGVHGWYFKNTTDKDITVDLVLKGQYELK